MLQKNTTKSWEKNENGNEKENEYDGDASLIGPLRVCRGNSQTSPHRTAGFLMPAVMNKPNGLYESNP
jgi:hypothetical protein